MWQFKSAPYPIRQITFTNIWMKGTFSMHLYSIGRTINPSSMGRTVKCSVARAGHATILSRQCDHVIRPQSCLKLPFYYNYCDYPIKTLRPIFLVPRPLLVPDPEAILRCRDVIVANLKNCRVPSSAVGNRKIPQH